MDESKEEEPLQSRLQYVWDTLQMSDSLRLDMAIKYSDRKFSSKLSQVSTFPVLSERFQILVFAKTFLVGHGRNVVKAGEAYLMVVL